MRSCQRILANAFLISLAFTAATAQADDGADPKTSLSAADTAFIQDAGASGIAEVQMGQMALSQSSDDKIKALAQRIVTDHGKANDALKALAGNYKVSFPSNASKDAQKAGDDLKAKKGSSFDQAWTKAMVKDHQDAIKLFDKEAKQTKDTDLQQFVKITLPTLKSHLDSAQQLAAVTDARDKAMDQTSKTMNSAMDSMPTAASTVPAATATKTTTVAAPTATSGAKH